MPGDDTGTSLLMRIRNNDPDAWRQFVNWIGPFILRWCKLAQLQPADVEAVSQQILQEIWTNLASLRKNQPGLSFRGWVYSLTRSRIVDFQIKSMSQPLTPGELPIALGPADANGLLKRAQSLAVQDLLARHKNDPGFNAFYRTAVDGLSATATAAEFSMHAWNVRQHRSRWIKRSARSVAR